MRRRAAANVETGSSLFTFLDGLICTMGALIVVLVVMVHQGKMTVQAALEAVFPAAEDESENRRSDLEWRIGLMRESRDKTLAQLDDARQALAHLEDHARRLRSQLEEQDMAHDGFQRTVAGEELEHEQLEAQVADAKKRIAAARSELDEKLHSVGTRTDSYAIIPYHGNNQTRRRPIYIECGSAGVVFQPEGIVLTEEDFAGDLGPSNPLASGLRAAREHMIRTRGSKPGDDGMPYPLLLVRPDGINAYLVARSAMGSWSTEFGYELIDQDWPIEFPPADPEMTMAMRQAVTEGRLKQAYLVRNAPRLMRHGERPSFGPSTGGGGLTRSDGSPAGGTSSRGGNGSRSSRPAMVGNGYQGDGLVGLHPSRPKRGSGPGGGTGAPGDDSLLGPRYSSSQGNDLALGGSGQGGSGQGGSGQGGSGQGGSGQGGNGVSPYAAALESLSQSTGGRGTGSAVAGGQNGVGAPDQGAGGSPGSGLGSGGQNGKPGLPNRGPAGGNALVAGGNGVGDGGQSRTPGTILGGPAGARGASGIGQGPAGQGGGRGSSNGGTKPGPKSSMVPPEQPVPNNPGPHARYGYGSSPDGVADAGDASGNDTQGGSAPSAGGSSGNANGPAGTANGASTSATSNAPYRSGSQRSRLAKASTRAGTSGSGSSSGSSSNSGSSSSPGTAGGGSAGGASQPGQAGGLPMPNMTVGQQPQSIADHRGKNWANKSADDERATEAIVPIKMVCDADHLSLVPERGSGQEMRVIKFGERTADSVNELVDAVWDQVDSWGTAGRGNYWRPKLVLVVEPGGERRFDDIKALLKDSGFDIEGRPRTPRKPKRPLPAKPRWPSLFRARPRAATYD